MGRRGYSLPVGTFVPYNAQATMHSYQVGISSVIWSKTNNNYCLVFFRVAPPHLSPRSGVGHLAVLLDPAAVVAGRWLPLLPPSPGDADQERP